MPVCQIINIDGFSGQSWSRPTYPHALTVWSYSIALGLQCSRMCKGWVLHSGHLNQGLLAEWGEPHDSTFPSLFPSLHVRLIIMPTSEDCGAKLNNWRKGLIALSVHKHLMNHSHSCHHMLHNRKKEPGFYQVRGHGSWAWICPNPS